MNRSKALAEHPTFPWLSVDDRDGVEQFLTARGWLLPGERVVETDAAGEGNMNLTLRVRTSQRSLILKQARPWVEKYDHIAAPWDRMLYEARFYRRVATITGVAERMPRLLQSDPDARALLLEDLGDASDLASLYQGDVLEMEHLRALAEYLADLHGETQGDFDQSFANREMRALNHEHIYVVPLDPTNALELEHYEPGLQSAARALQADTRFCELMHETGSRYLSDGQCLVHGDFFPGSWLRASEGVMVIDPEFCYFGDAEFDLGVAVAHLSLARQPEAIAPLLHIYEKQQNAVAVDRRWIARYAACEIVRRLIGVAQLPIAPSVGFRCDMLNRARQALRKPDWDALCA